ncbi:zinc-binding dehydrogenase [Stigmatella erecta]|uniref:NADPH:quinone reductase n=1 Tax=Stigmatella erecta TaxID=83460 RepID=A0A1I0K4Z9_9BACT|nr:zinc-binding dehydrogenase [Stigmatella erecta]SEU18834.1 NADPH:quinone reductase [Stigmatella erecta]
MSQSAKAWFLYAADAASTGKQAELVYGDLPLPDPGPRDVLVEPLYGSWEGNMGHCVQRKPIDVARFRGEERVVIGNAGVVRVLSMGNEVRGWKEGQCALILPDSALDPWGYPTKAFAYDMAGTTGFLSTRMVLPASDLVPLPEKTRHSYAQWAGFSARYTTAWSNWRLAFGTYRLMVPHERNPSPNVWGWGGGTTLAELDLARRHGCTTVMLSASDERLELIRQSGVTALDRRRFGDLYYDELRAGTDGAYRRAYQQAEAAFVREVEERTGKRMVQIFVDYIGTPFFRATRRVLSREGVITTAGWKEGMATSFMRATECIERHQYIHTHMCTREEVLAAIEYGEREGWMPTVDARIHAFDEVPALSQKFLEGNVGFFPVFAVNPE